MTRGEVVVLATASLTGPIALIPTLDLGVQDVEPRVCEVDGRRDRFEAGIDGPDGGLDELEPLEDLVEQVGAWRRSCGVVAWRGRGWGRRRLGERSREFKH